MMLICQKCGRQFYVAPQPIASHRKYCDRCQRKANIPTQDMLAKRAGRCFVDQVEIDSHEADKAGKDYGHYMAEKRRK